MKPHKKQATSYNDPVNAAPFVYKPSPTGANIALFVPKKRDPVLREMTDELEKQEKAANEASDKIHKKHKDSKTKKRDTALQLRADIATTPHPGGLSEFTMAPHNPPVPQFYTGTCWSFAATSYFESEIMRLSQKKIKLSEIYTVYFNYMEKARRFIRERGHSFVGEGDEPNAPLFIWPRYGIVPAEAYSGLPPGKKRHDHRLLMKELKAYLNMVQEKKLWDETWNLRHVSLILDKHLGHPPATFTYKGVTYTPKSFLAFTGLNLKEYTSVISTAKYPFFTWQELEAPDNWRKSKEYFNVPLEKWYGALSDALHRGHTAIIGGDVSEPGKIPERDLFFVPTFDIPSSLINQSARDLRIANRTTTDDHGIHLVGYHKEAKQPWFVFKDSGRSSRYGKFKGYYFVSGDYLRLKILTFLVHTSLVTPLLTSTR